MTNEEQSLSDDKMRAEIAHYFASAEKMRTERQWYPVVIVTGAVLAGVAITKLFL